METLVYYEAEQIAQKSWKITNTCKSFAFCYLIEGEKYALLIDSIIGVGNLKKFCETLTDKKIVVVNTHGHTDHIGGNFFFDHYLIHPRDMELAAQAYGYSKQEIFQMAVSQVPKEIAEQMEPDDNFADWKPLTVYPVNDGDVFDLGDRIIEVVEVPGHTVGSIVLIDHKSRIAYIGDACNGNTLMEFSNSAPVCTYMKGLLHLLEHEKEYDRMYGGHEIFDGSILREAIETVGRVLAGTDDREEAEGMMGGRVYYAAARKKDGYGRVDGKHFNMSYNPDRVNVPDETKKVYRFD